MLTTRSSRGRVPGAVACVLLVVAAFIGLANRSGGTTGVAADISPPGPIESVTDAATALQPARRLSIDATKPIFPMQTTPRCVILDNFGDPRPGGRIHEGMDTIGNLGKEVYAVVDGTLGFQVIAGTSGSELSGNAWRLTVAGGKTYYVFMHLSAFAEGLQNGSVVQQGQLIGYVGDTGNPGPGNYHLHFEVHPNGGTAVNPLTMLSIPKECSII
jgi:murein DD-endopeptidase MepM/ murein hydrolase activator NlpD